MSIEVNQLTEAINKELVEYEQQVVDEVNKLSQQSARELVKKTKATAPVGEREKHYKDHIASKLYKKSKRGNVYIWYVRGSEYRLSHLLEHGHAKRNGGRTKAYHFIAKATDEILPKFLIDIMEALKR